jgi:hypothetical protein
MALGLSLNELLHHGFNRIVPSEDLPDKVEDQVLGPSF